jgi:hypothetical protein
MQCIGSACTTITTETSACGANEYLEASRGLCVGCATGCSGCTGPSIYECTSCTFGTLLSNRCPVSLAQCELVDDCTQKVIATPAPCTANDVAKGICDDGVLSSSAAGIMQQPVHVLMFCGLLLLAQV